MSRQLCTYVGCNGSKRGIQCSRAVRKVDEVYCHEHRQQQAKKEAKQQSKPLKKVKPAKDEPEEPIVKKIKKSVKEQAVVNVKIPADTDGEEWGIVESEGDNEEEPVVAPPPPKKAPFKRQNATINAPVQAPVAAPVQTPPPQPAPVAQPQPKPYQGYHYDPDEMYQRILNRAKGI